MEATQSSTSHGTISCPHAAFRAFIPRICGLANFYYRRAMTFVNKTAIIIIIILIIFRKIVSSGRRFLLTNFIFNNNNNYNNNYTFVNEMQCVLFVNCIARRMRCSISQFLLSMKDIIIIKKIVIIITSSIAGAAEGAADRKELKYQSLAHTHTHVHSFGIWNSQPYKCKGHCFSYSTWSTSLSLYWRHARNFFRISTLVINYTAL